MPRKRTQRKLLYKGLGFPVQLVDAPMVEIDGEWALDVNRNALMDAMAIAVPLKPARLTGAEVRFLRLFFEMTLQAFADELGVVRQTIAHWESSGQAMSPMTWPTELGVRLYALSRLGLSSTQIAEAVRQLKPQKRKALRHVLSTDALKNRRAHIKRRLQALPA
jgi:DNA-binding transcriptional regulator YiaG